MPPTPPRRRRRRRSRARWATPLALAVIAVILGVLITSFTSTSGPTTGYDVSWPQCGASYPTRPLFAIVGVNGGLANDVNPCLASELTWARTAPGQRQPAQTGLSFYILTGNPGAHHVRDWPHAGTAPGYGACTGQLTDACSYLYGRQRAAASFRVAAAHGASAARSAPWWLDVELLATWAPTYALNVAALRGFEAGLIAAGASAGIGIYSTAGQWRDITGLTSQTTTRAFGAPLPDWIAGTQATHAQARLNCRAGGFTGAPPTLAQYRVGGHDIDLRCASPA